MNTTGGEDGAAETRFTSRRRTSPCGPPSVSRDTSIASEATIMSTASNSEVTHHSGISVVEKEVGNVNMLPVELTLIVAATRNMGIGRAGGLPWSGLKKEMAYFARVTKQLPPGSNDSTKNAVIMGRKTWDSIPTKFRPLKGRANVVLSRAFAPLNSITPAMNFDKEPLQLPSLPSVSSLIGQLGDVGKVFVIGGAEIYKLALEEDATRRILLTRVEGEWECDAFFPVELAEDGNGEWKKKSKQELDEWVGEAVPEGVQEEAGTKYTFEMWERG